MIHSLRSLYTVISSGAAIALLVTSCGSYQQASYYDNDGIYAEGSERVAVNRTSDPRQQPRVQQEDGVYGDYFGQKANEIDDIMADEIFTDVDSYYSDNPQDSLSSVESENYITGQNNYEGYAGWGDSGGNVTVNIYDNWGWGGLNYGWASPWLYGGGFGWGYRNNWGYGGFYNPWWGGYGGYGIGWGWGGYGGYYGYGGWGGYYNSFYCPPYYYNNNIYGGNYAYNRSRRGYFDRSSLNSNNLRGRSNLSARNGVASNRYRTNSGRSNIDRNAVSSRSSRTYRSGSNSGNVGSADAMARNRAYRSTRSTRSLPNYNNRSARSSQAYGNSSPQRSTYSGRSYSGNRSGGAYRSTTPRSSGFSGSSSRNSGSYRSSGSSAPRSSGYQSSGGSSRSSGSSGYRSAPSSSSSRSSGGNVGSSGSRSSGGGTRSSGGSRGGRNN